MRKVFRRALMGLAILLTGCILDSVPPSDGIYTGTLENASGLATDTISAVIDSNGAGVILDQTSASIIRFKISSVDNNGNFTAATSVYTGAGGSSVGNTPVVTTGTITGTLSGTSNGVDGTSRSTISGNLVAANGTTQAYSLTYQPNSYENNVIQLSTIVAPTNGTYPTLTYTYSYTPTTANPSGSNTVTLTLGATQTTSTTTSVTGYSVTGSDSANCTYQGTISMPDTSYNAFDVVMSVTGANCAFPGTFTGLAYVTTTVPATTLFLEYDNGVGTAIAASAPVAK